MNCRRTRRSAAIVEVAEGTLETAECPVQRKFGVLFHFDRLMSVLTLLPLATAAAQGNMPLRRQAVSF
jgi:hypothetical protein